MQIARLKDVIFIDNSRQMPCIQYDEGFSFGISFFETILVTDHGVFLKEHVHRINQSLAYWQLPLRISVGLIESIIQCYKVSHTALKIQVSEKNIVASIRALPYNDKHYKHGFHLCLSDVIRSSQNPLIVHKSGNYGNLILALRQAKNAGFDDCLFLNEYGHLTESSIANLFLFKGDTLYTPLTSDGLLPGIIRDFLLNTYEIIECSLTLEDLYHCDGAFLTNSLMGVLHIHKINDTELPRHSRMSTISDHYFQTITKEL